MSRHVTMSCETCHHVSEVQELLDGRPRGSPRERNAQQELEDATKGPPGFLLSFMDEKIENHISVMIVAHYFWCITISRINRTTIGLLRYDLIVARWYYYCFDFWWSDNFHQQLMVYQYAKNQRIGWNKHLHRKLAGFQKKLHYRDCRFQISHHPILWTHDVKYKLPVAVRKPSRMTCFYNILYIYWWWWLAQNHHHINIH